jgi:hypothetical protein
MPSLDEELTELHPDASERAVRKEKLKARLDTFLGTFLDNPEGGWPKVDNPTIDELYLIFGEIVDLKMARDEDGDCAIRTYCEYRAQGRMVTVMIPYSHHDENTTDIQKFEHLNALSRALGSLHSYAESVARELEWKTRDIAEQAKKREEFQKKLAGFDTETSLTKIEVFADRFIDWAKDNESIDPDAVSALRDKIAVSNPEALQKAIGDFMQAAEKMTNDEQGLFDIRSRPAKLFGKQFSNDVRVKDRCNELIAAGRTKRAADAAARRAVREKKHG